ncbi:kinesin-like protein KIFC1 [Cinclus cinclus]|uniref:kinesin-like protein KIFC1 n=1 Tax=Cinclus cinclus TaxID=127875 RepID=UPI002E162B96
MTKTSRCPAWPRPFPRPRPPQPLSLGGRTPPSERDPAPLSHWLFTLPPRLPIGRAARGRGRPSQLAPPLVEARSPTCARRFEGARDKMAALPQAGPAALPGPRSGLSRLPVARAQEKRAQEKRAPSCPGPEGPAVGPPQQKRSRTGLGPGGAKAAPKAPPRVPLRTLGPAAAAGKNDATRKAATVAAAPRTGSATRATAPVAGKGLPKRQPWDLRGQVGDLREALGEAQGRLQHLDTQKRELESGNQQLREHLEQLQRELGERERRESSLSSRVSSLESEVSQVRAELQQSRGRLEALETEKLRLQAEEEQRRQERDEARGQARALLEQLENTEARLQQAQQQLQAQLEQLAALRELEASQRALLAEHEERVHGLEMERRRLHNDIQELRGNIRVFCRVRPVLPEERQRQRGLPHLHFPPQEPRSLVLTRPDESQVGRERRPELRYDFSFDRVFPPGASQLEIFQEIQLLVQSALDGYPVCIFAYGQTGSGKTFTMEGPEASGGPESRGMIPRAVRHLFLAARDLAGKGWQYRFSASFLEIYNEALRDLLLAKGEHGSELEIRRASPGSDELHVPNLTWVDVDSEEQVQELLLRARSQRSVARTGLNERSSRSHSVFQLRIRGQHGARDLSCASSLTLVDLAGSERLEKSGSVGSRLRETQSINSSLSALGLVISALSNKEPHVPYRNSKLTFLLQNCLGGHAKVLMFVTISPLEENFGESLNSLRFASKVNECMIGTAQANRK